MSIILAKLDVAGLDLHDVDNSAGKAWLSFVARLRQSRPERSSRLALYGRNERVPDELLLLLGTLSRPWRQHDAEWLVLIDRQGADACADFFPGNRDGEVGQRSKAQVMVDLAPLARVLPCPPSVYEASMRSWYVPVGVHV